MDAHISSCKRPQVNILSSWCWTVGEHRYQAACQFFGAHQSSLNYQSPWASRCRTSQFPIDKLNISLRDSATDCVGKPKLGFPRFWQFSPHLIILMRTTTWPTWLFSGTKAMWWTSESLYVPHTLSGYQILWMFLRGVYHSWERRVRLPLDILGYISFAESTLMHYTSHGYVGSYLKNMFQRRARRTWRGSLAVAGLRKELEW